MIRAIHFSAIALLAAASLVAATSAGSQGRIEAVPAMSILDQQDTAPVSARTTGFGPRVSGDQAPDGKLSFVTARIAERVTGGAPNS